MNQRVIWFGLIAMGLASLMWLSATPGAEAVPFDTTSTPEWRHYLPLVARQPTPSSTATQTPTPTPTPTPTCTPKPGHLGYGANVSESTSAGYLLDMGFDWAKGYADPADRENPYGPWQDVVNQLNSFVHDHNNRKKPCVHHVLLRVRSDGYTPPPLGAGLSDLQQRCHDLAAYVKAHYKQPGGELETIAYEIWNEPNLYAEWGGRTPNPAEYVSLLGAAYQGITSADPEAIVVSAGMATGGNYDDRNFIRGMYQAGGASYFDVLGSHPYGGDTPPDTENNAVYFRRAEEQRAVMEEFGDTQTPVWATEFSWIAQRPEGCPTDEHRWAEVTEAEQAEYLVGAYRYADAHWPWMGVMFLFLDFGVPCWYSECEPLRWYSIYQRPYCCCTCQPTPAPCTPAPRPAVAALTAMEKHSAW